MLCVFSMFDDDSIKHPTPIPLYVLANNCLTITGFRTFMRYSNDTPKYNLKLVIKHLGTIARKLFRIYKISFDVGGTKVEATPSIRNVRQTPYQSQLPFQLQRNSRDRQTRRGRELTRWRRAYKRSSIVHHPPLEDSVAYINPFVPPFPTIKYSNSSSIEFRVIKLSRERERLFLKCFARAHTRTYTLMRSSNHLKYYSPSRKPERERERERGKGRGKNFNPWNDGRIAKGGKVRLII